MVPTIISKEFETLFKHIEDVNVGENKNDLENYNAIAEQFFQYKDANNTKRLIEKVKLLK